MRGVGKTTWAKTHFKDAYFINLLREATFHSYLTDAKLFLREIAKLSPKRWVVVDEVQRLPQLLNDVHFAIEEQKLRFALLGSSARKLRRTGVNLLGGRALERHLSPLLPVELGEHFSLADVLHFGSLPLILDAPSKEEQLEAYVQVYLKEEIQAEALTRNLPGFARFLKIAALFHGQVLSVEGLARDSGVARSTVQGYLDILEDTLLSFRLPAFEGGLRVKEKKHPKLYWLDSGVMRAAKQELQVPSREDRGVLFEGLIAQILRAYGQLKLIPLDEMYYWAVSASERVEVDFLIKYKSTYFAIEAKAVERLRPEHFIGLKTISELKGVKRRILVYLGDHDFLHESGIEVWTFDKFLKELEHGF